MKRLFFGVLLAAGFGMFLQLEGLFLQEKENKPAMPGSAFFSGKLKATAIRPLAEKEPGAGITTADGVVERMYATSTGTGNLEMALDGDPSTNWGPMEGAGIDEGILLSFSEEVEIGAVSFIANAGTGETPVKELQLYVNGSPLKHLRNGKKQIINEKAKTLYFRIAELNGRSSLPYWNSKQERNIYRYPKTLRAVVSEIELFGPGGEKLNIDLLTLKKGSIEASSVLSPAEAYNTEFLFDSRPEFGWAEGAASGGTGQKLRFKFDQPVKITKLKLWNGYQRSASHFKKNERLKNLTFGLSGGNQSFLMAKDVQGPQEITLPGPVEGREFTLEVKSVYPGQSYKDLVLSELRFYDGKKWFGLKSGERQLRKEKLKDRVQGTVLDGLVDRSLYNIYYGHVNDNAMNGSRSLILRSNSSFVLYLKDEEFLAEERVSIEKIADGNWEIVSLDGNKARIKIFGKLRRVLDKERYYKSDFKSDKTRIFKDFLTIDRFSIAGEKFFDSIRVDLKPGDMVSPVEMVEDLKVDLRYATADNFTKEVLYSECMPCLLRYEAVQGLQKAHALLEKKAGGGFAFKLWDCYRPYEVQKALWEKFKDPKYVADPYNGGSSHNKGRAVDITILEKGYELDMGTEYDHFGVKAHHGHADISGEAKENRLLLKSVMEEAGFKAFSSEWWHYSFAGQSWGILDWDFFECDY